MRFYDAIGYAESAERPEGSGIYEDVIVEKKLYGDVLRNTRALEEADKVNNDLTISNRFSLVADTYASENFEAIRYIKWRGQRYLAQRVEYEPPRLILTPGGVYNGPTPEPPGSP
jgi:hypothetical protein